MDGRMDGYGGGWTSYEWVDGGWMHNGLTDGWVERRMVGEWLERGMVVGGWRTASHFCGQCVCNNSPSRPRGKWVSWKESGKELSTTWGSVGAGSSWSLGTAKPERTGLPLPPSQRLGIRLAERGLCLGLTRRRAPWSRHLRVGAQLSVSVSSPALFAAALASGRHRVLRGPALTSPSPPQQPAVRPGRIPSSFPGSAVHIPGWCASLRLPVCPSSVETLPGGVQGGGGL